MQDTFHFNVKAMIPRHSCNTPYFKGGVIAVGIIYTVYKFSTIKTFMRNLFSKLRAYGSQDIPLIISSRSEVKMGVEMLRRKLSEAQLEILGMDCEWVSTGKRRHSVALLQLAAPDGFCSLFRLSSLKAIPADLKDLLEDYDVWKVGVAVITDARYLLADYNVKCAGCLDLRHLAAEVGVEPKGLAGLAHDLFGCELDKDWRVRCSNWEAETLTKRQIEYASADARIAIDIFNELNNREIRKNYSFWKRMFWTKQDFRHSTGARWPVCIDLNFKYKSRGEGGATLSARRVKPVQKTQKRNYSTTLQQDHYSNIFLLAPDNQILSTIGRSRADWYINKQLVDIIDSNTLKLRFEPSRRSKDPDNYYTRPKENRCVVCGWDKDLRRKNIVPFEYRKYFEEDMKGNISHDVLILCDSCHNQCNAQDWKLREKLVKECDAPMAEGDNRKLLEVPHLKAIRSAARALYFWADVLPAKRKAELEERLVEQLHVPCEQLNKDLLENLINIEYVMESDMYKPHGLAVVQYYQTKGGGIEVLERRWRQHFIETMSPAYLPYKWSVDYVRD